MQGNMPTWPGKASLLMSEVDMRIKSSFLIYICLICFGCAVTQPCEEPATAIDDLRTLALMYIDGQLPAGFFPEDDQIYDWDSPRYNKFRTYDLLKKKLLEKGGAAVPFIKELLGQRNHQLCILGCIAAGRLDDVSLIDPLVLLLTDNNDDVSAHASYALVEIGKKSEELGKAVYKKLPMIGRRTGYSHFNNRRYIYIVRKLGIGEAIPDLTGAFQGSWGSTKAAIVDTLAELGAKEAVPEIIKVVRNPKEDPTVRFRSMLALCELGAGNDPEVVKDFIAALGDEKAVIRWGGAMAFKKVKAPEAIPALIEAIADSEERVAAEAIRALYFQTGEKLTVDYIERPYLSSGEQYKPPQEALDAQSTWRAWYEKNSGK